MKVVEEISPVRNLEDVYGLELQSTELTYFISFTQIDKLGINPNSLNSNIFGIYTYPLRLVYKDFIKHKPLYASDREFIQILKIRKDCKVIDNITYTQANFDTDLAKLNKIYEREKGNIQIEEATSNKILSWLFSPYIKSPCFDALVKCLPNYYKYIESKRSKNKVGQDIYYLSDLLSMLITLNSYGELSNEQKVKWNSIIRQLGYEAIIDRKDGFLYPNSGEKCQAVFLSAKGYTYITSIPNPFYNTNESFARKITVLCESLVEEVYAEQYQSLFNN